jgi:hypothetical protein
MANCYFAKPHGMQHCYIPFLYVIDFKRALGFGEAQVARTSSSPRIFLVIRLMVMAGMGIGGFCRSSLKPKSPATAIQEFDSRYGSGQSPFWPDDGLLFHNRIKEE